MSPPRLIKNSHSLLLAHLERTVSLVCLQIRSTELAIMHLKLNFTAPLPAVGGDALSHNLFIKPLLLHAFLYSSTKM
jgi:hypothetical protein